MNARDEHRIGSELPSEMSSADSIDLLCSFLKWSGLRLIQEPLRQFTDRGGRLRVLTTCYLGATERRVIDHLAKLPNTEVRVSYDTRRTRLHAKAWLFYRVTGFHTAYIGSSNLSSQALLDGLEWNVRLSAVDAHDIIDKFRATYDNYWNDPEFEPYDPTRDTARFDQAIAAERPTDDTLFLSMLDVRPYPFQEEILDRLQAERTLHNRWRNLVVAATGTGKTVVAALDYRRTAPALSRANLLFVAHREEILCQSLGTFRQCMRDGSFGDLWSGGRRPTDLRHVFASIQTLSRENLEENLPPDWFDVVIVDEFHHAEAPTYRRLLDHVRPQVLLGLTATPERTDGQSILHWFEGAPAVELRLWHALERGLLCPFQYFGIHDDVDLSRVAWERGRYVQNKLSEVYTGDNARVRLIVQAVHNKISDRSRMRALGFCVSVEHAKFMAEEFSRLGIPSLAVFGKTPDEERRDALQALRELRVNVVFSVDVLSEGVDLPHVDTILLLRPTESATVFLQQLGRGLRLQDGKSCCTVLDFIGKANRRFRFDLRLRAVSGGSRQELVRQIEQGFPLLPSGCSMQLDRVAKELVLENVRSAIQQGTAYLVSELQSLGAGVSLAQFVERTQIDLEDLYRGTAPSWTLLRRKAGVETWAPALGSSSPAEADDERRLLGSLRKLVHLDDLSLIEFYLRVLSSPTPPLELDDRRLAMLHFALWGRHQAPTTLEESLRRIWCCPLVRGELRELLTLLVERIAHVSYPLDLRTPVPLSVHCRYSRDEVLAAMGGATVERPPSMREGVWYDKSTGCDVLFVTLQKSERDYSPTTMYKDYAISRQLFHWESQSTTRAESLTGKRYQQHGPSSETYALLFVRHTRKEESGLAAPYVFLGTADYLSHEGERPMAVVWGLHREIPAAVFLGTTVAA